MKDNWADQIDGMCWMIRADHSVYPLSYNQMREWLQDHAFEYDARKRVTLDYLEGVEISTVFLYHNHSFAPWPQFRPIIFETMVFGGPLDQEQERYSTWDEALRGHEAMLERVRLALAVQAQINDL